MVGLDRLELSTSPLSGVRSNHLSYRPSATLRGTARTCRVSQKAWLVIREERETKAADPALVCAMVRMTFFHLVLKRTERQRLIR